MEFNWCYDDFSSTIQVEELIDLIEQERENEAIFALLD